MNVHKSRKKVKWLIFIGCILSTILGMTNDVSAYPENSHGWSQVGFDKVKYFDEENILRLQDCYKDHNYFFIDLDGNYIENPELQSQYLVKEDDYIYNAFGIKMYDKSIEDTEWQQLIGCTSFDNNNWIWIKESVPTLEKTRTYIKSIDANSREEVFKIDCSSYVGPYEDIYFYSFNKKEQLLLVRPSEDAIGFVIDIKNGQILKEQQKCLRME